LNNQGTGSELSICKRIIEKMGGTIRVESEGLNHGTKLIIQMSANSMLKPKDISNDS